MPRTEICKAMLVFSLAWAEVSAQRIQNMDISILAGGGVPTSQSLPAPANGVSSKSDFSQVFNYGYQFHRIAAGDIWFELPQTFIFRKHRVDSTGAGTGSNLMLLTPSFRLQRTVSPRFAIYGTAGGGYGSFRYFEASSTEKDGVQNNFTHHGVFAFGGGLDFRLTERLSLRGEIRDFVSGRGLNGAGGRNHAIIVIGIATHF